MGHEDFDLLRVRMIRSLVRWGGFPHVFQAGLLMVFAILAARSWGVFPPAGLICSPVPSSGSWLGTERA